MTLDELPKVSVDVVRTHSSRLRNQAEYDKFLTDVRGSLQRDNPALYATIEIEAQTSKDPATVRYISYVVLSFVNDQLSANKLRRDRGI